MKYLGVYYATADGKAIDSDKLDGYQPSTSATANTIALRDSGGKLYATAFYTTSLKVLKENIKLYTRNALDVVKNTKIYEYTFKGDPDQSKRIGIIADETDSDISSEEHNKFDVNNTVGILIKAMQELTDKFNSEVEILQNRIKELESKLAEQT